MYEIICDVIRYCDIGKINVNVNVISIENLRTRRDDSKDIIHESPFKAK